jgi:chorismate lyase/3-hydroxybenzoate synthase
MSQAKSKQFVVDRGTWSPPATAIQQIPMSDVHPLHTAYVERARLETILKTASSNFLGIVLYDRSPGRLRGFGVCPVVSLGLPQFNEPSLAEVWTSTLPVTYSQAEGSQFAMNDEVLFGVLQLEERPGIPLDLVTYSAYGRLLVQARSLGYPHLLRMWNYFPHINLESDGLTRYQRFCVGRHHALAEGLSNFPRTLPAGTAVGTTSGPLVINFLAAREPGTHVENPRQVSAYDYPSVYGPRSPSFARATLRPSISGSHLLIAGTASVVGHVSEHIGAPHQQTLEILHNLNALVTHTEHLHGVARGQWYGQALFKVYIRYPEHIGAVSDILKRQLPAHTQVLYLQGEMCRTELLLEIEGILSQENTIAVSPSVSQTCVRLRQPATSQHVQPASFKTA